MRILGIDPGSRVTGWGVLESDGWELAHVAHGAVRCPHGLTLADRLRLIADGLARVIAEHRPGVAAVEAIFTSRSARAALVLGHARGAALLTVARADLDLHEYAAQQVKASVTGYGRAEKRQVQQAVATQLALREPPSPVDAADALATAICHAATVRLRARAALLEADGALR